jgi:exocyst complex component 2
VIYQTMMAVLEQLDQTLFGNFLDPKVAIATGKLRSGILDPEMDWYETPQPTGPHPSSNASKASIFLSALTTG